MNDDSLVVNRSIDRMCLIQLCLEQLPSFFMAAHKY